MSTTNCAPPPIEINAEKLRGVDKFGRPIYLLWLGDKLSLRLTLEECRALQEQIVKVMEE